MDHKAIWILIQNSSYHGHFQWSDINDQMPQKDPQLWHIFRMFEQTAQLAAW